MVCHDCGKIETQQHHNHKHSLHKDKFGKPILNLCVDCHMKRHEKYYDQMGWENWEGW